MISKAESVVMNVLWERGTATADAIIRAVAEAQSWSPATVRTLLNRLLKKKAVSATRDGRRYIYQPLLARADYVSEESESLLNRLFDGRVAPLVSNLTENRKLSPSDIAELRRLIEELDDGS